MANIGILGSSFSHALYKHKDERKIQKISREDYLQNPSPSVLYQLIGHGIEDRENHWVNLLAKKYPQHTFHVFAEGGTGWEYSQQMLHMLTEEKICDRIIVELCEYRAIILGEDIAFNRLNAMDIYASSELNVQYVAKNALVKYYSNKAHKGRLARHLSHYIPHSAPENYMPGRPVSYQLMIDQIKEYRTVNQKDSRDSDTVMLYNKFKKPYVFSTDVLEYMIRSVISPVYITRYRHYLSSLTNVWPKIFDKVGVWAYTPFNVPSPIEFDANKEYFDNSMQYFEDTMLEEWIRKDPINNSADSWKDKYYGFDGGHLNKEGMPLLVDFLLKQSSIQRVLI
jgi:hypothetical protein